MHYQQSHRILDSIGLPTPSIADQVEPWSYADDSYRIPSGGHAAPVIVVAQVSKRADLRWLSELKLRAGAMPWQEVKSTTVHRILRECDARLRATILGGVADSAIIVLDLRRQVANVLRCVNQRLPPIGDAAWGLRPYKSLLGAVERSTNELALLMSPLHRYVGSIPRFEEYRTSLLGRLCNPKNVRCFSARFTASSLALLDGSAFETAWRDVDDLRYVDLDRIDRAELLCSLRIPRAFDEGNDLSIREIRSIRERAAALNTVDGQGFDVGAVESVDSKAIAEIQAADIAAGIARDRYETGGLRALIEHFRVVVFNGRLSS